MLRTGSGCRIVTLIAMLAVLLVTAAARGEEKANPEYAAWAKYKPGTTAVYSVDVDGAGAGRVSLELTSKLIEVKADKVIVEQKTTMSLNGQTHASPAKQREIPSKKEFTEPKLTGEEDVEVSGKKIHCKVLEGAAEGQKPGAGEMKAKLYMSEEVPGGVVKMAGSTPQGTMTTTLKSFEIK